MYAPVATRFQTYDVKLDRQCADYCETILNIPDMIEWIEAARTEKTASRNWKRSSDCCYRSLGNDGDGDGKIRTGGGLMGCLDHAGDLCWL
jgi:hypothetical protein